MFKRLTQLIGMVDIDVTVEVETSYPKDVARIEGVIRVAAEQDQTISKIDIQMTQRTEEGSVGDSDRRIKQKVIGTVTLRQPFDIKKGETKSIPFALDFKRELSLTRKMAEQGGLMGMIGKAYTAADNERWQFWVEAVVDVKGAAIDPTAATQVFFGN